MALGRFKTLFVIFTIQYKAFIVKHNLAFAEAFLHIITFFSSDHMIGLTMEALEAIPEEAR